MKKVLHVIESFDGQAVESWLYQMMLHMNNQQIMFDWTFFVTLGKVGKLDDLVREAGGKIIYSQAPLSKKRDFIKDKVIVKKNMVNKEYLLSIHGTRVLIKL